MKKFNIKTPDQGIKGALQTKIDLKTKPPGSLGSLEALALQIGLIQQSTSPQIHQPHLVVFAADHGISKEGLVNPFPQEVTFQMVMNFLSGKAAVNVLANQHNLEVTIVDAGVNYNFGALPNLVDQKVDFGTKNYLYGPAMTRGQCEMAIEKGANLVNQIAAKGCNTIGFGEMGIANTSSASLLMHHICQTKLEDCVGKGTGANPEQLKTKLVTLQKVLEKHQQVNSKDPMELLATFGGFEIAQICGAMLQAAENRMLILVDGFIATAALLVANQIIPEIHAYCVFAHCSGEKGHEAMLEYLKASPLLKLGMRLGEGSGAAVAFPLIQSACTFLNEMASFESAGVSQKSN
ncbi:nicotinate-nucleotide--dimethylbenzimidazole phosphoribosyltransferase [Echinicola jeungdonensis]|uniref:Nicotinate-nucleotide--dimethylbenzimidazole phosphoribosyltransferase n=1 Tax=Echinicola jeungdonensis TaxID=709343 RepID=A0ABV5J7E2_9BACT|nr:nicotinate-nucleotide--dimethylbenzimidazole phosphoribosyltransferase [Echinicola jeungdonensis]MDN3671031.1 nicotinate-nucleotide--dimethylbenzimidazole phosphoribosyltransferase [Echinicola jeungdonensis]